MNYVSVYDPKCPDDDRDEPRFLTCLISSVDQETSVNNLGDHREETQYIREVASADVKSNNMIVMNLD